MKAIVAVNSDFKIDFPTPRSDKRRFAWLTLGAQCVMGRRTWDSLPETYRPLPHRHNYVITNKEFPEVWETTQPPRWGTWAEYLKEWSNYGSPLDVWIVGGGEIYAAAMPHIKMIYLSYFPKLSGGTVTFPESLEHFTGSPTWEILQQDITDDGTDNECVFSILKRR